MRIISGYLGGRHFDSPHNNYTHPMSEKMRGALFNSLGDISGLDIFDPFAGTGACSYEAISRGASSATLIESNTESFKTALANVKALGLENKITIIRGNCDRWSSNNKGQLFDIVISDPPYQPQHIDIALAFKMSQHLVPDGIFILSVPPTQKETVQLRARQQPRLELITSKVYGDASLWFYRKL